MNSTNRASDTQISRVALPIFALFMLAALASLYLAARPLYINLLSIMMMRPFTTPFFDLEYLFTTTSCWQRGVDVYVSNPCDQLDRPMGYSPLWLRLGFLAIDRGWSAPWGLCLSLLFCLSLALLPPTRALRDQAVIGLAAMSSLSLFALERGNVDVMIYLASVCAACLLGQSARLRTGAYVLLFGAGLMKFYPFAALVAISQERLRPFFGLALAACAAMGLFYWSFHGELHRMARNIPHGSVFSDLFGAMQLPVGLGASLYPILAPVIGPSLAQSLVASPLFAFAAVIAPLVAAAWIVFRLLWLADIRQAMQALPARPCALFLIGAALIAGCFFTGQSVGYRGVLLLLVIPGFLALARPEAPRRVRRMAHITLCAILAVMFRLIPLGIFTRGNVYPGDSAMAALCWLASEICWWWIASVLLGLLLCILCDSPAARDARQLARHGLAHWRQPRRALD